MNYTKMKEEIADELSAVALELLKESFRLKDMDLRSPENEDVENIKNLVFKLQGIFVNGDKAMMLVWDLQSKIEKRIEPPAFDADFIPYEQGHDVEVEA